MRIIGGRFRGRRLVSLGKGDDAAHLRPTTDRVRESLFNMLASRYDDPVSGAVVLDVFAGTGALGLEALSRGAESITFVENGRKALSILERNISALDVQNMVNVIRRDARRLTASNHIPAQVIFMDPPYGQKLGEAALTALERAGLIADDALIIWEESDKPNLPPSFRIRETREFGLTKISFVERAVQGR